MAQPIAPYEEKVEAQEDNEAKQIEAPKSKYRYEGVYRANVPGQFEAWSGYPSNNFTKKENQEDKRPMTTPLEVYQSIPDEDKK